MFYEVIPARLFRKDGGILTYAAPTDTSNKLAIGTLVIIPLGKSSTIGVVTKILHKKPDFSTKPISQILYNTPLPQHLIDTIFWLHDFYLIPLPTALSLILPQNIQKSRRIKPTAKPNNTPKLPFIPLNSAQKQALQALKTAQEATKLLHGVTGSGKTNIYLELAKNALESQKSTILLVPEIALTSQLVRVFEATFGQKVILLHSKQTEAERHLIWLDILNSTTPKVIIGPRSALFAPLSNLGLIIIDECHESTYYQENSPKYSALRVASFIAKNLNISCINGSATPLVQDYFLAKSKNSLVTISQKAKDTAITPDIKLIDFKNRDNFLHNRYFSDAIIKEIKFNLEHHYQTLIFHNRRGSAPLTICENCGEELLCPHCFLPLTLHADNYELICHACGYHEKVPSACPKCHHPGIIHKGFGTKLLESELKKLFKDARIARFDADNKKSETLDALYDDVKDGKIDIIIGTQTVAKGLDLPNLATVCVVQADAGLSLPDYAAEEKTFELLTQVMGRVGRGHINKASVIVQTFQPDHPTINFALQNDYANFYNYLLKKRQASFFPPFAYLAKLEITMKTEKTALLKIKSVYDTLCSIKSLRVSAPTPAFHEHSNNGFTWQIIVRATSRQTLLNAINSLEPNLNLKITLDPPSLL